jgi:A/G-specific adenine glycosylase
VERIQDMRGDQSTEADDLEFGVPADSLGPERVLELRARLLAWFAEEARELPWRRTDDPYAIWVSEAMLQQTQVATVIDYWYRFLKRFPSVGDLARADDDSLMGVWSGLGYYSRARNLRKAASIIVEQYGGRFPRHREEALGLPGVGRYTAGAVLSIAYDLPEPLVDGNVARVFARLFALDDRLGSSALESTLWKIAERLVPTESSGPDGPGAWNQALMELGAVLCSPREPRCLLCPVQTLCSARERGLERELPRPKLRPKTIEVEVEVALVRDGERLLLYRRPDSGRMPGMWELPTREVATDGGVPLLWPDAWPAPGLEPGEILGRAKHGITKYRITARLREASFHAPGGVVDPRSGLAWVPINDLANRGLTGMTKKLLRSRAGGGLGV